MVTLSRDVLVALNKERNEVVARVNAEERLIQWAAAAIARQYARAECPYGTSIAH